LLTELGKDLQSGNLPRKRPTPLCNRTSRIPARLQQHRPSRWTSASRW
jgi:hypothetical protein